MTTYATDFTKPVTPRRDVLTIEAPGRLPAETSGVLEVYWRTASPYEAFAGESYDRIEVNTTVSADLLDRLRTRLKPGGLLINLPAALADSSLE